MSALRWLLLVVVVVVASGVGIWWTVAYEPASTSEEPGAGVERPVAPTTEPKRRGVAAQARDLRCTPKLGTHHVYEGQLSLDNVLQTGALYTLLSGVRQGGSQAKDSGVQRFVSKAEWTLNMRVLRSDSAKGSVLAVRYARMIATKLPKPGDIEPVFLVQLGPRCNIERFAWRKSADKDGARSQQSYLRIVDFKLPGEGKLGKHRGTATDERGTYDYNALLSVVKGEAVLDRRKIRYRSGYKHKHRLATHLGVKGPGLKVKLSADAWFESATINEEHRLGRVDNLVARHQIDLSMKLIGHEADERLDVNVDDDNWQWGILEKGKAATARNTAVNPKLVGVPFARFIGDINKMLDQKLDGVGLAKFMKAWLAANPKSIHEIERWLRTHGTKRGRNLKIAKSLLTHLASSGRPAARDLLRRLITDPGLDEVLRSHATVSLMGAKGFDKSDLDALLALSRREQGTNQDANYATATGKVLVGAVAHKHKKLNPELAKLAVQEVAANLANATNDKDLKTALTAVGNTGAEELLPALTPHLSHEDPYIRKDAADALRLMPLASTAETFIKRMAIEQESIVKEALVEAMWFKSFESNKPPPQQVLAAALQHYQSPQSQGVTRKLTTLLGEAVKTSEAAKQALIARFRAELAKKANADTMLLQKIGRYIPAEELMGH